MATGVASLKTLKNITGKFIQATAQAVGTLVEIDIISDALDNLKAIGVATVNVPLKSLLDFLAFAATAVSIPFIYVEHIIPVGGVKFLQFVGASARGIASFGDRTVSLLISAIATVVASLPSIPAAVIMGFFGGSGLGGIATKTERWVRRKAMWMKRR